MQRSTVVRCVLILALAFGFTAPSDTATGRPILWRDPQPIGAKDLYWGVGSANAAPRPPFVFVKEDNSGTKPKVEVTDANGAVWIAKFASQSSTGTEVHSEIAASRLLWALGYFVEEHYFVANGTITGVKARRRRTS